MKIISNKIFKLVYTTLLDNFSYVYFPFDNTNNNFCIEKVKKVLNKIVS